MKQHRKTLYKATIRETADERLKGETFDGYDMERTVVTFLELRGFSNVDVSKVGIPEDEKSEITFTSTKGEVRIVNTGDNSVLIYTSEFVASIMKIDWPDKPAD